MVFAGYLLLGFIFAIILHIAYGSINLLARLVGEDARAAPRTLTSAVRLQRVAPSGFGPALRADAAARRSA